jgi:hypothetical protein
VYERVEFAVQARLGRGRVAAAQPLTKRRLTPTIRVHWSVFEVTIR